MVATNCYTEIIVSSAFRDLVDLIAAASNETFSDVVDLDGQVSYSKDRYTDFDITLEEHFVPFDISRTYGGESDAEGRCVRVRRGDDGSLRLDEKRYRDAANKMDAMLVCRLLEDGDLDNLRALALSAVDEASPHPEPIEGAEFFDEHRSALEELRQTAEANAQPRCRACGAVISD